MSSRNLKILEIYCIFASDFRCWFEIAFGSLLLNIHKKLAYEDFRLHLCFLGATLGLLVAPEKGTDTRERIAETLDDFCKKHNLKLSRKEVNDLVADIKDASADAIVD